MSYNGYSLELRHEVTPRQIGMGKGRGKAAMARKKTCERSGLTSASIACRFRRNASSRLRASNVTKPTARPVIEEALGWFYRRSVLINGGIAGNRKWRCPSR